MELVVWCMNGVAMARNGLVLWENEATSIRKVFRYFPGLRDAIQNSKMTAKVQKYKNTVFHHWTLDKRSRRNSGGKLLVRTSRVFFVSAKIGKLA